MSDLLHRDLPEIVAALAARVERLEDCTQTAVRVAELESASKLAPAANADAGSNHAPAASGAAVGTCNTFCGERECERADPGQCRRGAPQAASGAAGNSPAVPVSSKPVAWAFVATDGAIVHVSTFEPEPRTPAIVPLYAAPQAAKGWLTAEEREALAWWCGSVQPVDRDQLNAWCAAIRNLLARSSPPEVVLDDFTPDAIRNLDTKYLAGWDQCMDLAKNAIRAAGVQVKEVGK